MSFASKTGNMFDGLKARRWRAHLSQSFAALRFPARSSKQRTCSRCSSQRTCSEYTHQRACSIRSCEKRICLKLHVYSPNRACYCRVLADLMAIEGHPSQRASRTTNKNDYRKRFIAPQIWRGRGGGGGLRLPTFCPGGRLLVFG